MSDKISIAIPTYNSSKFILRLLSNIIDHDRVDDIIISDDASSDYDELVKIIDSINNGKIKYSSNSSNLKALKNKFIAVSKCKNDVVALIDSDNIIDSSFIDNIDIDYMGIQMPSFAKPRFNFKSILGEYKLTDIKTLLSGPHKNITVVCLNTGNFVFPKKQYLEVVENYLHYETHASDVVYVSYLWLKSGNFIKVVDKLEYEHTFRDDSFWIKNSEKSLKLSDTLINTILHTPDV